MERHSKLQNRKGKTYRTEEKKQGKYLSRRQWKISSSEMSYKIRLMEITWKILCCSDTLIMICIYPYNIFSATSAINSVSHKGGLKRNLNVDQEQAEGLTKKLFFSFCNNCCLLFKRLPRFKSYLHFPAREIQYEYTRGGQILYRINTYHVLPDIIHKGSQINIYTK